MTSSCEYPCYLFRSYVSSCLRTVLPPSEVADALCLPEALLVQLKCPADAVFLGYIAYQADMKPFGEPGFDLNCYYLSRPFAGPA